MGYARNIIIVRTADAIIAVDGEYGTLSEISHELGFGFPVIGLKTWNPQLGDGTVDASILVCGTPHEAVAMAAAEADKRASIL